MKNVQLSARQIQLTAWGLSFLVTALALVAWGQGLNWKLSGMTAYKLFPLFGLLAFSLMWTHYVISVIRRHHRIQSEAIGQYFKVTSWVVLIAILMHPGLLIFQLWRDGFGVPPNSYLHNYVAPGLEWAALLGTVSLLAFLAYELHRWFAEKSWFRYVGYASDAAMLGILVHSLRLGSNLQAGWLHSLWLFYGLTYLLSLLYIYLAPKPSVS